MAVNNRNKNTNQDLGLGGKVIQQNRTRFINRDGSFNVYRKGVWEHGSFSIYHAILNETWPKFFAWVLGYYVLINVVFAVLFLFCGRSAFPDMANLSLAMRFRELFFYSVAIISTLGSSPLHQTGLAADVVSAIESIVGLFGLALAASLMFARFSNPATRIIFSDQAVIAPYDGITGFMVRIINGRNNELVGVAAVVTLSFIGKDGKRDFATLKLERDSVQTFPLNWTIVHPIEPDSPLYGMSMEDLYKANAEFVVNISATDQDLSKTVYARSSYKDGEIVKGRFVNIIETDEEGTVYIDPKRVSEIELT
jgi:inward rectifier potassium channel